MPVSCVDSIVVYYYTTGPNIRTDKLANLYAEKADAVVKSINDASPGRAIAVAGDVQDQEYLKRIVQKAVEFGGKINIIVNNAGFTWDGVIHKVRDTLLHVVPSATFFPLLTLGK